MKLYCFYLYGDDVTSSKYPGIHDTDSIHTEGDSLYYFYAYTPDKKIEKLFKSTREMSIFKEKIVDISDDDYDAFCEKYLGQLLEKHRLDTSILDNNTYKKVDVLLYTTYNESSLVINNDAVLRIMRKKFKDTIDSLPNISIFKGKIISVLRDNFMYDNILYTVYPLEDENYTGFEVDRLSLYIHLYINTYKKGCDINEIMEILL